MRNFYIIFFVVFLFSQSVVGQILKGKIIDSETNLPIEYANVGIEGTLLGSATDSEGNYTFKYLESQGAKYLYVSAIGYQLVRIPISSLVFDEANNFTVNPQTYGIDEVDINAQSLFLYRLVREAYRRIPVNFKSESFTHTADYICTVDKNGEDPKTRTSVVKLTDATGYKHQNQTEYYDAIRYSFQKSSVDFPTTSLLSGLNKVDEIIQFDIARNPRGVLNENFLRDYDFSLDNILVNDGDSIYVVNYVLNKVELTRVNDYYAKSVEGKLFVRLADYGVVRNECWVKSSNYNRSSLSLPLASGIDDADESAYFYVVSYKREGGSYQLDNIRCDRNISLNDEIVESHKISYEVKGISNYSTMPKDRAFYDSAAAK